MDMASNHPIINLPVCIRSMVDHSMGPSSGQAGVVSHGVEVVAESSAAAEGSVVGSNSMGTSDGNPPAPMPLFAGPGRPPYPVLGRDRDVN
jgi:hypothetical protein